MTELAVRDEGLTLPSKQEADATIERVTYIADKLAEVVKSKGWFATIQGKAYLEVEAWQFIGFHLNVAGDAEYTRPITDDKGEIIAYETKWILTQFGQPFSSGIMSCGMDSFPTQGKAGWDKHKAAQSASQTWAVSKAYRNKVSFIARMAGYEPTPADEMRWDSITTSDDMDTCPHHNVTWFKRGKMQEFAHVVEGQEGPRGGKIWCNKLDVLRDLDDAIRTATEGYDRDKLVQLLKNAYGGRTWPTMTPVEKLDAIQNLQTSPEEPSVDEQGEEAPY